MTGGVGNDVFVFADGFGRDTIMDFQGGAGIADVIEFKTSLFANFTSVIAASTQVGGDTVITFGAENTLTLKNVSLATLSQDDFRFV